MNYEPLSISCTVDSQVFVEHHSYCEFCCRAVPRTQLIIEAKLFSYAYIIDTKPTNN